MAIGFLQQQAFSASPDFQSQTHGIVRQQALLQSEKLTGTDPATESHRQRLAQVSENPAAWGFVGTLLSDAGWAVTYDAWAMDPDGMEGAILASVQKWWTLRTGLEFMP